MNLTVYCEYTIIAVMIMLILTEVLFLTEIKKLLLKLSKERGCELIGRWRNACVRHFYWAITSTHSLLSEVKLAKFQSFLYHILNKHQDLPNRLFNACRHGEITVPKVWMTKSKVHYDQ